MNKMLAGAALVLATLTASTLAQADCWLFCGSYTKTKYPLVLVHGSFGFDQIGPISSFYGIPQALTSAGASVYVPQVSAVNSTEVRGEQLLAQVQNIVAITGKPKVNLIGHSHGAPTARYVAGVAPQLVASVTSVAGDSLVGDKPGSSGSTAVLVESLAKVLAIITNGPLNQDYAAMNASLSVNGVRAFSKRFPDGVPTTECGEGAAIAHGIRYYSWSGDASASRQITNIFDISDVLLAVASGEFNGAANDGLVGSCASHLGKVIRDNYLQNHLDEINHVLGLVSPFTSNPKALFREQANRLKNAGL